MINRARRSGAILLGIVVLGVAVRALSAFGLSARTGLVSDAGRMAEEAAGWLTNGHPEAFYLPPGNTALLLLSQRLFGVGTLGPRIAMVLVSSLTVLFAARLGGQLAGRRAMFWTGIVGALYTPAVLLCGQSYSQHLAGLCLVVFADQGFSAFRKGRVGAAVCAGLALGIGALARPSTLSVAPVALYFALTAMRRAQLPEHASHGAADGLASSDGVSHGAADGLAFWMKTALARRIALAAGVTAVVTGLCVLPAMLHNRAAGEGWAISTNNERNLFLGNCQFTPDYKTSHLAQRLPEELPDDVRDYLLRFEGKPDQRRLMRDAAVEYMLDNPGRTLYRTLSRARAFWGFDYLATRVVQQFGDGGARRIAPALLALEAGCFLAVAALATVALTRARQGFRRPLARWLLALVVAYQVPYLIAFASGTYHFPVMGLVWPFAGVALASLTKEGVRAFVSSVGVRGFAALAVLFAIQIEYAYQTLRMASP
ncbi:MAG: glycosyltransferase family 39 protein [Polyangiaceae bacterium]